MPGVGKKLSEGLPRGEISECVITVENQAAYEVNVYLDTVWQGSLEPHKKANLIPEKGDYEYVHAISLDDEYKWVKSGDCSCERTFELKQPEVHRIQTKKDT